MMRLYSLRLDNVRAIDHLELQQLPDTGVFVIHGENEAGKSTIMDAIHACLNLKYSSKKSAVKALIPVDKDQSPEIELDLAIGPYRFSVYKCFSSKKIGGCELQITEPKPANFTGDEAEEKLAEIIDSHLDANLLASLFVRQGELDYSLQALGIPSLEQALNTVAHSERGEREELSQDLHPAALEMEEGAVVDAANAEYLKYFTKTGKPTGELRKAENERDRVRAEYEQAQEQYTALDKVVTEYDELSNQRDHAASQIEAAEDEVERRAQDKARADAARDKRIEADKLLRQAELERDVARERKDNAQQALERLEHLRNDVREANKELTESQEEFQREEDTVAALSKQREQAEKNYHAQRRRLNQARAREQRAANNRQNDEWTALLERVAAIDKRIVAAQEHLDELPAEVDDDQLDRAKKAQIDLEVQTTLAEANTAHFEMSATEPTAIDVDGQEHQVGEEPTRVNLEDGTVIRIGALSATYRGGAGSADDDEPSKAQSKVDEAQENLLAILDNLSCDTVEEVTARHELTQRYHRELNQAKQERAMVVGDEDLDEIARSQRALATAIAEAEEDSHQEDTTTEEVGDSDDSVDAAVEAEDASRDALDKVDAQLAVYSSRPARTRRDQARAQLDAVQAQYNRDNSSVDQTDAEEKIRELTEVLGLAEIEWKNAVEKRNVARQNEAEAQPEQAGQLYEGAKANLENIRETIRQSDKRLHQLDGHIDFARGTAERVAKLKSASESAQARYTALCRRADAAKLLLETLIDHQKTSRAHYVQPFAQEVQRFARAVFGSSVDFELDEDLSIISRTLDGTTVSVHELSGGAKEQLALLTRLAIAALTVRGQHGESTSGAVPVPVMVDDALGSTDSTRLTLMATLFSQIAKYTQVFVLTCMPERYSHVVGAQRYSMAELTGPHTGPH